MLTLIFVCVPFDSFRTSGIRTTRYWRRSLTWWLLKAWNLALHMYSGFERELTEATAATAERSSWRPARKVISPALVSPLPSFYRVFYVPAIMLLRKNPFTLMATGEFLRWNLLFINVNSMRQWGVDGYGSLTSRSGFEPRGRNHTPALPSCHSWALEWGP